MMRAQAIFPNDEYRKCGIANMTLRAHYPKNRTDPERNSHDIITVFRLSCCAYRRRSSTEIGLAELIIPSQSQA